MPFVDERIDDSTHVSCTGIPSASRYATSYLKNGKVICPGNLKNIVINFNEEELHVLKEHRLHDAMSRPFVDIAGMQMCVFVDGVKLKDIREDLLLELDVDGRMLLVPYARIDFGRDIEIDVIVQVTIDPVTARSLCLPANHPSVMSGVY